MFVMVLVNILFSQSDALRAAKTYVGKNDALARELGPVHGFGFTCTGSVEVSSDASGEWGTADIVLIAKGEKKFKELEVWLVKEKTTAWEVKAIQ
jgi:hypothetical protein